jgi:hypothetical protein
MFVVIYCQWTSWMITFDYFRVLSIIWSEFLSFITRYQNLWSMYACILAEFSDEDLVLCVSLSRIIIFPDADFSVLSLWQREGFPKRTGSCWMKKMMTSAAPIPNPRTVTGQFWQALLSSRYVYLKGTGKMSISVQRRIKFLDIKHHEFSSSKWVTFTLRLPSPSIHWYGAVLLHTHSEYILE